MNITESKNGGVYVIDGEERYQLSAMQLKILALTFHSTVWAYTYNRDTDKHRGRKRLRTIRRRTLADSVFGERCFRREPLTASQRAAMSRTMKRLHQAGLLERPPVIGLSDCLAVTRRGQRIVRQLVNQEIVDPMEASEAG